MVVPESQDKMYYPPDDMRRDAHVPDFNSYLALYRKSLENPEGRSSITWLYYSASRFFLLSEPVFTQHFFVYLLSLQLVTVT